MNKKLIIICLISLYLLSVASFTMFAQDDLQPDVGGGTTKKTEEKKKSNWFLDRWDDIKHIPDKVKGATDKAVEDQKKKSTSTTTTGETEEPSTGEALGGVVGSFMNEVWKGGVASIPKLVEGTAAEESVNKGLEAIKVATHKDYRIEVLRKDLNTLKTKYDKIKKEIPTECGGGGETPTGDTGGEVQTGEGNEACEALKQTNVHCRPKTQCPKTKDTLHSRDVGGGYYAAEAKCTAKYSAFYCCKSEQAPGTPPKKTPGKSKKGK